MDDTMDDPKKPCVYALYIPGGGVFGLIPAMMLEHLHNLTGLPTYKAFPVQEAVSTGAIIVAGLTTPNEQGDDAQYTEKDLVQNIKNDAPHFFPPMPGRARRLAIFNSLSHIQRKIDPLTNSRFLIRGVFQRILEIKKISQSLDNPLSSEDIAFLDGIREKIRKRWISKADIRFIARHTKLISSHTPCEDIKTRLKEINEFAVNRVTHNGLSSLFHRAGFRAINYIREQHKDNIHYNPETLKAAFKGYFGENNTISDLLASVYISTYDVQNEDKMTFYSHKKNILDFSNAAKRIQSRIMPKTWDAVMASISSQLAFPAHRMETGHLTEDWAPIHTPQKSIDHVIDNLPKGYDFKLVIMGTGDNKIPYHDDNGTIGNLLEGRTLRDLFKYTNSDFHKKIISRFGSNSIIEFNPRRTPRTIEEYNSFPNDDMTDASDEQINRIMKLTNDYISRGDMSAKFKELAMDIVDNMYRLGQIDFEHAQKTRERCGLPRIANDNHQWKNRALSWGRHLKKMVAHSPRLGMS